jgi:peptidoglycan/LPS O-acetylase OafA/YrhL
MNPKNGFAQTVTWLSLLSYPMYLVHTEMQVLLKKHFQEILNWNEFLVLGLKYSVVILFSLVLYYVVHEPFIKLRTKVVGK